MRGVLVDTGALVALVRARDKHHARIAELMRKYADRPMDFADASLMWAAEETGAREILTTDRDFEIYRTRTQERLQLVLALQ